MNTIMASVEIICSQTANQYLAQNKKNRKPCNKTISKLAKDMANGNWHLTGDSVKFDTDGVLIDGQHRLMAVVQCGIPQQMLVVRNVTPAAKIVTDTGKPRVFSNVLEFDNCKNAKDVATIARAAYEFHHGKQSASTAVSHCELIAFLNENPEIHDCATWSTSNRKHYSNFGHMAIWGAVYFATGKVDEDKRDEFFDLLKLPPQNAKHPCTVVKNTLIANYRKGRFTASRTWVWAVIIKSWNAYMANKEVSMYKFLVGEPFPVMAGYEYPQPDK